MKALITGASSGIGRDMARYLTELNYDLILVARNKKELDHLKKELKTNVKVIKVDLIDENSVFKLYDQVKKENVDFVINNAGFGLFGKFHETDLVSELEMIDLNIKAVHILTKLFLKDFVKQNQGRILNVASSAGFLAGPTLSTYYATKNYVLKLTMAIYEELKESGSNVKISALCPGPVNTNFNKVAEGKFTIKGLSSEYTAKYGIDKCLKDKLIIIPGTSTKIGVFLSRFLPYKLMLKISRRIQEKKQNKNC